MNRVTLLLVLVIIVIVVYAINNPVPQPTKHSDNDHSGDHSGDQPDQPGLPPNSPPPNSPPPSLPPNKPQPNLPPEQPTDMNRPGPSKPAQPSNGNTIGDGTTPLPPTLPAQSTGSAPPAPLPPTLPTQSTGSAPPKHISPRVKSLINCGDINRTRGWYDVYNQGARNDYCAYMWFGIYGCAIAGTTDGQLVPMGTKDMQMTDPHDPYITGQINGCP